MNFNENTNSMNYFAIRLRTNWAIFVDTIRINYSVELPDDQH